ncbi:MAG TPA: hypothetical protein VMT15_13165 [Bryobacteraceae bacterium]|nr:hypothetical protein [Bryobacteraceae bacterium]
MHAISTPPESNEIPFQISLLNIALPEAAERQIRELEQLLNQQTALQKR